MNAYRLLPPILGLVGVSLFFLADEYPFARLLKVLAVSFLLVFVLVSVRRDEVVPMTCAEAVHGAAHANRPWHYVVWLAALFGNVIGLTLMFTSAEKVFFYLWAGSLALAFIPLSTSLMRLFSMALENLRREEVLAVLVVVTIGFASRVYPISTYPMGHFEAIWGIDTARMRQGEVLSPFHWIGDFPNNFPSYVFSYFAGFFPNNILVGLRLGNVLAGTATIPLLFVLIKLISRSSFLAIAAAAAFSISPWMINESIFASNFAVYIFLQFFFLTVLFATHMSGNNAAAFLCGLTTGMLFNMLYVQFTTFIIVLPFFAFLALGRGASSRAKANFLWVTASFVLCTSPTICRFFFDPVFPLLRHEQAILLTQTGAGVIPDWSEAAIYLVTQLLESFGRFFVFEDLNQAARYFPEYYWPPVLSHAENLFLLLGIGVCLRHFRTPPCAFLIGWFALMYAPYLLRIDSFYRLHALAPLCFVFMWLGVSAFAAAVSTQFSTFSRGTTYAGAVSVILVSVCFRSVQLVLAADESKREMFETTDRTSVIALAQSVRDIAPTCTFFTDYENRYFREIEYAFAIAGAPTHPLSDLDSVPEVSNSKRVCVLIVRPVWSRSADAVYRTLQTRFPEGTFRKLHQRRFLPRQTSFFVSPSLDADASDL